MVLWLMGNCPMFDVWAVVYVQTARNTLINLVCRICLMFRSLIRIGGGNRNRCRFTQPDVAKRGFRNGLLGSNGGVPCAVGDRQDGFSEVKIPFSRVFTPKAPLFEGIPPT